MSTYTVEQTAFFGSVRTALRASGGKRYAPTAKRWRNTQSGDGVTPRLDMATRRFLVRLGVLDAGDEPDVQQRDFEKLLRAGARQRGEAPGVLAAYLKAFAGGEPDWPSEGICGERPRCSTCPLCEDCLYLTSGAKATRLSATALAQQLTSEDREVDTGIAELLAFLLFGERKGAGAVARVEALLQDAGGLRELLQHVPEREDRSGRLPLPLQVTARLRALRKLIDYWSRARASRGRAFKSGSDLYEHYHLRLRELKQECFYVACLDQKNRLLADESVSTGSLTEALVHPREVLNAAIRNRAAAIAVVHNHPSGDPTPSRPDRQLTRRLKEAADLVGIRMVDHVIVGDGRYFSFAESGTLR